MSSRTKPLARALTLFALLAHLAGCGGTTTVVESGSSTTPVTYVVEAPPEPESTELIIGGSEANFGIVDMTTGFLPDPALIDAVAGGGIDAGVSLPGSGCVGWVTSTPDLIINFEDMSGFLRFGFRPEDGESDTTLIINDGAGNWHCNDDGEGVGLNPMVDIDDAPPGQYDIWIGSYQQGQFVPGQVLVTEISDVTP